MDDFKIFIGAHGAATIVFFLADNVDFADVERIGGAHDGADIEIMLEVFDDNL